MLNKLECTLIVGTPSDDKENWIKTQVADKQELTYHVVIEPYSFADIDKAVLNCIAENIERLYIADTCLCLPHNLDKIAHYLNNQMIPITVQYICIEPKNLQDRNTLENKKCRYTDYLCNSLQDCIPFLISKNAIFLKQD